MEKKGGSKNTNLTNNVVKPDEDNKCPKKEGNNCLVSGVFSDSEPIGGG